MTSQDIKKQLKEPHFWNIVLTGQHAEPRIKAMLEAKGGQRIFLVGKLSFKRIA